MSVVDVVDGTDDLDVLDGQMIGELRDLLGDEFPELVELYLETADVNVAGMHKANAGDNMKELREHAHGLKGACQNIGALRLARVCAAVETHARDGQAGDMNPLLVNLSAEADAVRAHLQELL